MVSSREERLLSEGGRATLSDDIERLEALLRDDPRSGEFVALAQAYIETGRFGDAVRVCRGGLPGDPDRAEAHLLLGRGLRGLGELSNAKQALSRAVELDPHCSEAASLLAEVLAQGADRGAGVESEPGYEDQQTTARPEGWSELQDAWGELLEQNRDSSSDPISDLREPSPTSPAIEMELPPLSDPLARGMPPLPDDEPWSAEDAGEEDSGYTMEVRGTEPKQLPAGHPSDDTGEASPSDPAWLADDADDDAAAEASDALFSAAAPVAPSRLEEGAGQGRVSSTVGDAREIVSPDPGPRASADSRSESQLPAHQEPPAPVTVPATAADGRVAPPRRAASTPSSSRLALGAPSSPKPGTDFRHEVLAAVPLASQPTALLEGARPGRSKLWILLGMTLVVLAATAAGVAWWVLSGRSVQAALAGARAARLSGRSTELDAALLQLEDASRYRRASRRLADEAALLWGTRALLYGIEAGPAPRVDGNQWVQRAARATLALSANDISAAAGALTGQLPSHPEDRRFHQLLAAWTSWGGGKTTRALELIAPAPGSAVRSAARGLLRGLIYLERGELTAAEGALRPIVDSQPPWRLPQLILAAVLLRAGAEGGQVDPLIDPPVTTPLAAALQRILRIERRLQSGQIDAEAAAKSLALALDESPGRRTLLDLGVVGLLRLCRFELARTQLERLAPKATGSDGLAWLRVELALAAGLDAQAVSLLPAATQGERSIRLGLRARLLARQLDQAQTLLERASPRSETVRAVRSYLASRAGQSPQEPRSQDAIATASAVQAPSPQLALTLAVAALSSDDPALALRLAHPLRHSRGVAARWIAASALLAQGNPQEALSEAEALLKQCPSFAGANALVGRLLLEQGSYEAAERAFRLAIDAGSRGPALLLGHARALAELSRVAEAERLIQRGQEQGAGAVELALARAQLALASGDPATCRAALAKSRDDRLAARMLRGRCLAASGLLTEAELVLHEARRVLPRQPLPQLLLGLLLQRQESPEARAHLRSAAKLAAGKPLYRRSLSRAQLGLARQAARSGRPSARSFKLLVAAIRADERYAEPFVQLGRWRLVQGRHKEARRALVRAVELASRSATAHYLLALSHKTDPEAQRRSYEAFLQLENKGKRADAARLALSRLP